jgi:creatinine amidohydrolase
MKWEEMTPKQLAAAAQATGGVCLIPLGCFERHGNHMPVGVDILTAREIVLRAVAIEPAVVFPFLPFGAIEGAKYLTGSIALSTELLIRLLFEIFGEVSRNGFKKVVIANHHGGNNGLLSHIMLQAAHAQPCDYTLYLMDKMGMCGMTREELAGVKERFRTRGCTNHGGEIETSLCMAILPGVIDLKNADGEQTGCRGMTEKLRQSGVHAYAWFGDYPGNYTENPYEASQAEGEYLLDLFARRAAVSIRAIKEDQDAPKLRRYIQRHIRDPVIQVPNGDLRLLD